MRRLDGVRRWRVEKVHWVRVGAVALCVAGVCGLLSDPPPAAPTARASAPATAVLPARAPTPPPPPPPAPVEPTPPPRFDLWQVLEATAESQADTGVVVHGVEFLPQGVIRLSCHATHDDLRRIAAFRNALRSTVLCVGRELRNPRIWIHDHRGCAAHGEVDRISQFEVEFAPAATLAACPPPPEAEPLPCVRD